MSALPPKADISRTSRIAARLNKDHLPIIKLEKFRLKIGIYRLMIRQRSRYM